MRKKKTRIFCNIYENLIFDILQKTLLWLDLPGSVILFTAHHGKQPWLLMDVIQICPQVEDSVRYQQLVNQ